MEILINELSLNKQFATTQQFVCNALIPFLAILKECDKSKDVILKKHDFWSAEVTENQNLHSVLTHKSDEVTRFKSLISYLQEPFWNAENSQKHSVSDTYEYCATNITGSSLAESCERDKVVISFNHTDFIIPKLQIVKNKHNIEIDNLFQKEHYVEVAYNRNQINKCEYFKRKFELGLIDLLENECKFTKTNFFEQGQRVYREKDTNYYWYLDNFHKDYKRHYEVFDSTGKQHIGEACLQGILNRSKQDSTKRLLNLN